jgi:uncharacterized protein (DUF1697 family)
MKYVALLRGIGPANPNMHQAKLCGVLEELGFSNVKGVISSGNVVFESNIKDGKKLEDIIEKAWPEKLGFNSTTIIRSQRQLQSLADLDPYNGVPHSRETYQLVTFFKNPPRSMELPGDGFFGVNSVNALCTTLDVTTSKTPDFMAKLERAHGKEITSRTWKTVQRILQKME